MKKKNILILAIAAVVIIAAGIVTAVVAQSGHVNIEEQLSLGERYLTEGDYEKAVLAFTKVIEADPMNADAYMGRAKAYAGLGQLENARADFDQCLEIDANNLADRYLEYGKWLESIGLTEEAQKIFEEGYEKTGDERLLEELKRLTGEESSGEEESSGTESSEEEAGDPFMACEDFVPFEEIPEAEQKLILLLIQELPEEKPLDGKTESMTYLKTLAPADEDIGLRTVYENWKIEYWRSDSGLVEFEMREENGKAYSYRYSLSELHLEENGEDVGEEDGEYEEVYRASTVDWQVNGEVTSELSAYFPVTSSEPHDRSTTSGQAKDNVRIGTWTTTSPAYQMSGSYDDSGHQESGDGGFGTMPKELFVCWWGSAAEDAKDFHW